MNYNRTSLSYIIVRQSSSLITAAMIFYYHHLALYISIIFLGRLAVIQTAYLGCYQDSPVSRELYGNPGNYNPSSIDATECEILCGTQGHGYAGLTAGKLCLCGPTMTGSTSGTCDALCPGDVSQTCGTSDIYNSVYTALVIMTGFKISPTNDILETYALTTINFNLTSGSGVIYSGKVYDGGPNFGPLSTQYITYHIRQHGRIVMTATAANGITTLKDETVLQVQTRVRSVTVSCPSSVEIHTQFECILLIAMGTNMDIHVDMDDGTVYQFISPDTIQLTTGKLFGVTSGVTYPGDVLYVMPEHIFTTNGTLVAVEFISDTTGVVYIQVYRPGCSSGLYYCPKSNVCINDGLFCNTQILAARWKQQCNTGQMYSVAKRQCVDMVTESLISNAPIQDWSQVNFPNYTLTGELSINIPTTGEQFYEIPDNEVLSVQKGDILALKEPSGKIAVLDATGKNYEFYYDVNSDGRWLTRFSSGYDLDTTPNTFPAQHAIKAYLEKPSKLKFRHTFNSVQLHFNVTATVHNNVTNPGIKAVALIENQVPISNVMIIAPFAASTNGSVLLTVAAHNGTSPEYTWNFGTGVENKTTFNYIPYSYNESGVYIVTVTASNDISSATNSCVVIVQDTIQGLSAPSTDTTTIFGNMSTVFWNISQGTNVSYTALMGDDYVYTLSYPFTGVSVGTTITSNTTIDPPVNIIQYNGSSNGMEGFISHRYLSPGWYTFTLVAENHISKMNITFYFAVQILITGLIIQPTNPIPFYNTREIYFTIDTGSHLQLNASINGTTLPDIICDETTSNGTVMILSNSYKSVGPHHLEINITNLVSPIVSETLEVWIDYRITNLSIGIDRSYIPVDDNMTFNIGMQWCSRFTSYIDFVDGSPIETTYYDLLMDPEKFNYTHAFTFPGVFSINFTIENPVDYHNSQHNIYVQYGVKNIDVQWTKTVRIEPGSAGLGRLWVRFMGGVPLPTSASCLINFDDNTTSTHPLEEPIIETTTKSVETTEGINCDEVFSLCNTSSNDTQTTQQPVNTTVPQCPYMLLTECLATTPSPVTTPEPTAGTTIADDFFSIPVDHEYSLEATYDVTVNISNLVSYMYFTLTFEVDKPIYDLILIAEPSYVVKNAYASLNVSMSWGSRVICAWYIGDGTPSVSADCDHYSQTSYSHLFTQVGVFHPEVYAINAVSSSNVSSSTGPIIVQVPVTTFSLRCPVDDNKIGPPWFADYKTNVTFELLWEYWQNEYPTNASYTIDFGDGTVTSPVLLKTTFDNQNHLLGKHLVFDLYHTYLKGGNYTVSINIWNLVSNETYTVSHDIYEALVGLDVNIFDYNPATGQDVVGGGLGQNYFALENPVKFVASHQRGSHVTYTWKYGDQIQESFYYEKEAFHMYDKDTCFTTELTAKNFHNELKLTRFICIQRGCFNISIFCDNPRAKNSTFIYQIDPGTVGTDACYMINFNSDMAYPYQYIMFGDATQCSVIPEWSAVWNDPDKLWFEKDSDVWYSNKTDNPTNYNISVDSTFIFEGYYYVSLFCQNKVSNTQHDFRVGVTTGPCWWPYVNVSEPNKCIEPFCDHDTGIDDLKTHYKSEKLVVKSDVIINCTATKIAYFYWQVFYIDESSMNETEIANLSGADVYSIGARQLILEPRTLDYGLYRIRLNVSMNEVIGMVSVDECYIRIIPSPLQFEINGGDFMMRRWGDENPLNIDALSLAFDPDVDPTDKSGMTFIWMCRRLCETWPKYRADFTIKRKFKTNCTYSVPDDRGCSKVDKVDTSGILPNASGGMLDTLFSGDMYENDEVEIKAYLIKGDRRVHDTQRIYIAEGDPPIVGIKCITNCASKMNTDSRFGLETYIDGWTRGVYFYYRWVLYGRSWYGGDNVISTNKWESFASTGSEGPNMAILPNCPLLQSNSSMSYYFRVKTWRWGTSEMLCGWAEKSFMINERPSSASAYVFVTPSVGIAYETNFKIECGGFYDYENGGSFKLYKFGYRSNYNKAYIWFHKGDYPNNIGSEGPIPDGLPENGYMVEIVARAYDHDGAFADALTYIRVDPANQQDVSDILANATSEEGIVNNLFVGADIKIAPVAKCLGKFLNEEADNALSDQDIIATTMATTEALNLTDTERLALEQEMKDKREADKARRTETRQAIMDGFKRIQTGSVEAVQNTAAALSELTLKEDELSETAQEDAVEILRCYTDQIGRETHISADDREETAITLVEVLGNMMHAAGYMAEKAEDESTVLYNDYIQSVSTTPSGTSSQALSPAQYQQIQNELARQKAKGKDTFLKIKSQSDDLIKTISSYKVVGEKDAILESKKLNITLRKRMTIEMNDNPIIEVGGQSSVLMPKSQSIFGDTGNETSWFVETEAIRMPNNPFTWTDTSSSAAQKISSDVVSLKYRNDSGGEVIVRDNAQMFDLFVDRSNYDTSVTVVRNITRDWHEPMVLHSVNIENTGSLHIKLEQILNITDMIDYIEQMIEYDNNNNNTNGTQTEFALELKPVEWYVFIRANDPPTTTEYDFTCTLPLSDEELDNMMSYVDGMAFENDTSAERSTYIDIQPDRYTCFFTSDFLSINESTKYYIGIKHKLQNMSEDDPLYWLYYSTLPPTTTTVPTTTTTITYTTTCWTEAIGGKGGKGRRKRAGKGGNTNIVCSTYPPTPKPKKKKKRKATPAPTLPPEPAYKQAVYRLSIFSAYCIWWDATIDQWSNDGCVVGPLSTPDRIHCLSNHLTSFAAGFAVPMNTIDLNDSAFSKLDENPIIFCTMVSMMCLYILMCVWARKRDMVDKIMAGSSPLLDNDPRDKYLYEIQVFTGSRKEAGTTAKVSFVLTGDKDETQPRFLADDKRPVLQTSNTDGFVMAVPKPLGKLTHLRIWHDNMGTNPSWYFSRMQIEDLQTGDKYFFICENWLSLDDDDGLIDRVIPVAGRAELTSFNYLFWTKTKYTLADGHLWFSIFKRPAKSNFTRVQRLTCCLSLLFCTMCTSIAFYQSDESSSPKEYGVGPVTFTLTGLYIGIASGLMSFPVNLIIMCFFRYSKPFPKRIEETLAYRFYGKFLCFSCFKKKVNTMEEKQAEELKNDLVGNARKREKSDVDTDAVKIELENELDLIDNDDYFNKDKNVKKENVEDSSKFLDKNKKKPSAELNPIPRVLKLKKDVNKRKPLRLPYWGIYIGYVLSFCTVAVAFWATVEFGGVFGPKKSLEWLISFFISCIESIFFSQPIKVIIIAIIYATIIKKPEANDEDNNDRDLEDGEEWLHSHLTEEDLKNPNKMRELEKIKLSAPLPPELDFLKTAKEERAHELAMYALLKEIAICVFFLYFVLLIAYTNRDPWSYYQYSTYNNMFNLGTYSPTYSTQFQQISSIDHFWNWTQNALLNSLFYTDWYNGDVYTENDRLIQDKQTILVGSARLRQLRTKPYKCIAPLNYLVDYCRDGYSHFSENTDNYKLGWEPVNTSDPSDVPNELFTYRTSDDIGGHPYWGIFSTYGGGGYVTELGTTMTDASSTVDTIMNNNWVDNNTRAIFIEVNLYNPNNNLFGICLYVLEFLQTGGIEPFERFFIFRLDRYSGGFMYFVMAIELTTVAFILFYTVKEVRKIRKMKMAYFKEFWNVWEIIVLAMAYGLILVFIYRTVISVQMMKKIRDNPNTFVNFFFAIVWDECCGYFIGLLVYMETLRFLRLLRFNRKVALFGSTMMYISKPLLSFGLVFMSGFLAFSTTAYFFFNTYMFDFRTFIATLNTLLSMMLGKFDYEAAWTSTRVAGPIIFGMFALCFNFILVNFFLTIVIDGFQVVRNDLSKQSNDYEVIDHMMKKIKMVMGIDVPKKRKGASFSVDPRLHQFTYIEGKTSDEEILDELNGKVKNVIQKCNGLAEFPEDDELEEELNEVQNRKRRRIVVG